MKVTRWLEKNSAALQAVAAIIAICGVLLAIPLLWKKAFRADLVLQVNFDESTVPPGLLDWSSRFRRVLPDRSEVKATDASSLAQEIQQLS
jgi:hypothetical protein